MPSLGDAAPGDAPGAPTDAGPRGRAEELRAQVERGEITQDSMRAVLQAMRADRASPAGPGGAAGSERETRPAAVFVVGPTGLAEPRLVEVGLNDWDYTEVVSGLDGTETLAVVGPAQLQAQQQEFLNMMRSRASGPFGGGGPGGRGGR